MIVTQTPSIKIQIDGGSNSMIFTKRKHFWYLQETTMVVGVTGKKSVSKSIGPGIVLARIKDMFVPLYSCFLMPDNPQKHTWK